jgi:NADP-dependent alcohol dehydrogenase
MKLNEAINKKPFFHTMGMDTKLSDYTKDLIKQLIYCKSFEKKWLGLKTKYHFKKVKSGNELLISILFLG